MISERTGLRAQAYDRVARGLGGAQVIGGPILVVPVHRGQPHRELMYVLPEELDYVASLRPADEPRRVGIFDVPVYEARIRITGRFDPRRAPAAVRAVGGADIDWGEVSMLLPITDPRGIRAAVSARLGSVERDLHPASQLGLDGLAAPAEASDARDDDDFSFQIEIVVAGSRAFSVLPLGARTTLTLDSSWPHPSFIDTFLPSTKNIRDDGFDALWTVYEVNRAFGQAWILDAPTQQAVTGSAFGVELYQPVDAYQRTERAVKYAGLFIAFTFMAFFCYERVRGLRIHPLQYGLVGLALSVFYLLLLAISEHVSFGLAYLTAAAALVALLGTYVAGALRSRRHGVCVAGLFTLVYALLYALILSEDYALLVGALAVFAALAAMMLLTRRVDWYSTVAS